jgi:hypothetical protein
VVEGDNSGGLLIVEIEDLLLDAASGLLHLPLLVLAKKGEVSAHIQRHLLPSHLDLHLRERVRKL